MVYRTTAPEAGSRGIFPGKNCHYPSFTVESPDFNLFSTSHSVVSPIYYFFCFDLVVMAHEQKLAY